MTNRADTIRRIRLRAEETLEREILHNNERRLARDVLTVVSARLQAINERDGFRADCEKLVAERQQAIDERDRWDKEAYEAGRREMETQVQLRQAIDALRFYADPASYENATPRTLRPVITDQGAVARAALLSLGEPTL